MKAKMRGHQTRVSVVTCEPRWQWKILAYNLNLKKKTILRYRMKYWLRRIWRWLCYIWWKGGR